MTECYDRAKEKEEFNNCSNNVIFFVNSQGNGMSTFLYNVLQNKQYIFLSENINSDIVFNIGDANVTKFERTRRYFIELKETALEESKSYINLFYLLPSFGEFLANIGINISDKHIKNLNQEKFSFESFLSEYLIANLDKDGFNDIYLVIDHADNCSYDFLYKLNNIMRKWGLKLIFCIDSPIVKAEFKRIFNSFKEIDFSKPVYEEAIVIFKNLKMDSSFYDKSMYETSKNIFEFTSKYQTKKRIESYVSNPIESIILEYLIQITSSYGKIEFKLLCDYLVKNAMVNQDIDWEYYFRDFLNNGIISNHNNLYRTTESYQSETNVDQKFIAFVSYILNFYNQLSKEFLFFIFKISKCYGKKILTDEIILYILKNNHEDSSIRELIDFYVERKCNYFSYLNLCKILCEKQLFEYLFEYQDLVPSQMLPFQRFLNVVIKDKKHKKVSVFLYNKYLKQCFLAYPLKEIHCILLIIYLDFCINHSKKTMKVFFDENSIFYYKKYEKAKYYYILESIIAFYEPNQSIAMKLYSESIQSVQGISRVYMQNNKFAYLLSKFANTGVLYEDVEHMYEELLENKWVKDDSFLNTNILLYESLKNKQSEYKRCFEYNNNENLPTWDFYKILNGWILDFIYLPNFSASNYESLKKQVFETNRAPAKNIYFYNLFIMANCTEDKKLIKTTKYFLEHNSNFRHSNLYASYKRIKNLTKKEITENKRKHVRFGYIFSRITNISYLFDEIAVFNK